MTGAILATEARIIARHSAFAGFSIPLEANENTPSPILSPFGPATGGDEAAGLSCGLVASSFAHNLHAAEVANV